MKNRLLLLFVLFTTAVNAQNWQVHNSFSNDPLSDIHFITPAVGVMIGNGDSLYRTTDAGDHWSAIGTPDIMVDLEFASPAVGYACGSSGAFMKTIDGGANWTTVLPWTTYHLRKMSFVSADTGYVIGYNTSNYAVNLWKTTNGGTSWNTVAMNITNNTCHDLYFLNDSVGFIAHMGGFIIEKTTNGGVTWVPQNVLPGGNCMGLRFTNDTVGYAVGHSGVMFKTTDQGASWMQIASPTTEILYKIHFLDSMNGWICGYTGIMLNTVNGGLSWNIQPTPVSNTITNVCMVTPTYGWAVTSIQFGGGDVLKYGNYYNSDSANVIHGNVYADFNSNCIHDAGDAGQLNWFVQATPGPFYGVTDAAGNYEILVPPGTFTVSQIIPVSGGLQVTPCSTPAYTVTFPGNNGDTTGFDFINSVTMCSYLVTDIVSDRRRRCRRNTTSVYYWNFGYAPATNAEIHVDFPEYVVPVASTVPWTLQADSTYLFNVGTIQPQTFGSIIITDSVVCGLDSIRGFTQCTEAWITPANTCPTPSTQWDGSTVDASAKCLLNGYLRFTLKNIALSMSDSAEYRIYMNSQLIRTRNYMLAAGDSLNVLIPTNGQTFRIEADQRPNHPTKTQTNASVEGCTVDITGNYVTGYIPQLPPDEEAPEVSIHCLQIIDAFDPNEKSVEPGGITSQHLVQPGTELSYLIHFQNCGTDTAFDIFVIDTLSPYLDVTSILFGAASHPYTVTFLPGPANIIRFNFANILLPDSTTNEPGSNGFVSYTVRPDTSCPLNAIVENYADIYFDFNLPVRTDTAWIQYSTAQPTATWTDSIYSQYPLVFGPDSMCAGDSLFLFVIAEGPVWWSTQVNPADTLCTGFTVDTVLSLPQFFVAHTAGGNDTFFVTVVDCAIGLQEITGTQIQLAPNPAGDEVQISAGSAAISRVEIYHTNGQRVYAEAVNANSTILPTKDFAAGVYSVLITLSDSSVVVRKLVIAH